MHDVDVRDILERMPWFTRLIVRVFGRRLNSGLFYPVLGRAYEHGLINSQQLHALHSQFDPTQAGVVGRA